jgi:hypothetical protein
MNRLIKPIQIALVLAAFVALSGCGLGQAAEPTATPVDVNAVMTSAAATAFVQLTQIAGQASATPAPTQTPTTAPPTGTPDPNAATATQGSPLQLLTPTDSAGGLPVVETPIGGGLPTNTPLPNLTPIVPVATAGNGTTCFNSKFVADVTVPDGTVLQPGEKFRKVWRIQNTGTCKWDQGFGLTIWAGPAMGGTPISFSGSDQPVEAGGTVDLGIDMVAPDKSGDYIAHWVMINDSGKTFGGDFTVVIKVP